MRQLARPADASVERLVPGIVTIAAVGFQEVVTAACEGDRAIAAVQRDEPHQALVAQVT